MISGRLQTLPSAPMSDAAPDVVPHHAAARPSGAGTDGFVVPPGFWLSATLAVARRPGLWATAVRTAVRTSPRGWWRRPPFVPRPDAAFLRFRFETAYGHDGTPSTADFVHYLQWCRDRR